MNDIVPEAPDLKDMISTDEAEKLEGYSFEEIEELKKQGKLSSEDFEGQPLIERKEVERLEAETDILQEEVKGY